MMLEPSKAILEWLCKALPSLKFQLIGALFVAVFLPVLIREGGTFTHLTMTPQPGTMFGAGIAILLGHLLHRRMTTFPGVQSDHYILPIFAATFLTVVAVFFFFRLEYTRTTFLSSFLICCVWFLFMGFARRRITRYRLAIVPIGRVQGLEDIDNVDWARLTAPDNPTRNITGIVADLGGDLPPAWEHFLAQKALSGVPVFHVKQIRESLLGRVEIEHLAENTLGSLNPNQAYLEIKQTLDWIGALLGLTLCLPLFAVVAIAIKLDSPGPVLFRQRRKGYRGADFSVYKFRTMIDEVPAAREDCPAGQGHKTLDQHSREHAVTKAGDRRITRVGRFLRRTRLDELPQMINILRDEMSWIGPRPEAIILSEWYNAELPFYSYRHIVRPGVTGWAQVNQGHVAAVNEVYEKLQYDFYYIKNFSFWLDVLITLRTVKTILTGFGAK